MRAEEQRGRGRAWPRVSRRPFLRTVTRPPRRRSGNARNLSSLLVGPDQLDLPQDMSLHLLLQVGFGRLPQISQSRIERVQLVKVAVSSDRRAGAAVSGALPVVDAFAR